MQKELGFAYWDMCLKPDQAPQVRQFLEDLCWKLGECKVGRSRAAVASRHCAQWSFLEPPELIFSRSTMMKIKIPRVSIKVLLNQDGAEHVLVDSDFLVVLSGNVARRV